MASRARQVRHPASPLLTAVFYLSCENLAVHQCFGFAASSIGRTESGQHCEIRLECGTDTLLKTCWLFP